MAKYARLAPSAKQCRSPDDLLQELEQELQENFSLPMLQRFSVILEGWTDVGYVELAMRLYKKDTGDDLLEIPSQTAGRDGAQIGIFTPGKPGDASRGGTPQMERLATMLKPYVFTLQAFDGLMFVFDHDDAGQGAASRMENDGYRRGANIITLDPKEHPKACTKKQVCVEDLLSLDIQHRFFDTTASTCSLEYVNGELQRIDWGHVSKPILRDFVVENATLDDVEEIVQLVKRVRCAFSLPV